MANYKELIERIRQSAQSRKHFCISRGTSITPHYIRFMFEAANAIEQLCADVARLEAENRAKEQYIADAIEQLVKERDAYAKCFRIMRTDEPFTNHAVFKVDYKDLICHTEEEIANALVYGFARIINEWRGVQEEIG